MVGLDYCLNDVYECVEGPRLGLGALARVLVVDSVVKVSRLPLEMNLGWLLAMDVLCLNWHLMLHLRAPLFLHAFWN